MADACARAVSRRARAIPIPMRVCTTYTRHVVCGVIEIVIRQITNVSCSFTKPVCSQNTSHTHHGRYTALYRTQSYREITSRTHLHRHTDHHTVRELGRGQGRRSVPSYTASDPRTLSHTSANCGRIRPRLLLFIDCPCRHHLTSCESLPPSHARTCMLTAWYLHAHMIMARGRKRHLGALSGSWRADDEDRRRAWPLIHCSEDNGLRATSSATDERR